MTNKSRIGRGGRSERKGTIEHLEGTSFSQTIFKIDNQLKQKKRGGGAKLSLYTKSFVTKLRGAQWIRDTHLNASRRSKCN